MNLYAKYRYNLLFAAWATFIVLFVWVHFVWQVELLLPPKQLMVNPEPLFNYHGMNRAQELEYAHHFVGYRITDPKKVDLLLEEVERRIQELDKYFMDPKQKWVDETFFGGRNMAEKQNLPLNKRTSTGINFFNHLDTYARPLLQDSMLKVIEETCLYTNLPDEEKGRRVFYAKEFLKFSEFGAPWHNGHSYISHPGVVRFRNMLERVYPQDVAAIKEVYRVYHSQIAWSRWLLNFTFFMYIDGDYYKDVVALNKLAGDIQEFYGIPMEMAYKFAMRRVYNDDNARDILEFYFFKSEEIGSTDSEIQSQAIRRSADRVVPLMVYMYEYTELEQAREVLKYYKSQLAAPAAMVYPSNELIFSELDFKFPKN